MGLHVKKGDVVQVMAGKDRGVTGRVLSIDLVRERVIVEGVNRVKKHRKAGGGPRGQQQGGIITAEAPGAVASVQLVDPTDNRPTRVRYERRPVEKRRRDGTTYEGTRSVRISVRTGNEI